MKVILHAKEDVELVDFGDPGLAVEAVEPHAQFGALQMFATSLGMCTYSVLAAYGAQIEVASENLRIRVRWSYAEQPRRIAEIDMRIRWPGLPDSRLKAAQRAAEQCTLHATLAYPPRVGTEVA
jgi:uncharacterized OsmC-like protein